MAIPATAYSYDRQTTRITTRRIMYQEQKFAEVVAVIVPTLFPMLFKLVAGEKPGSIYTGVTMHGTVIGIKHQGIFAVG